MSKRYAVTFHLFPNEQQIAKLLDADPDDITIVHDGDTITINVTNKPTDEQIAAIQATVGIYRHVSTKPIP